MADSKETMVFYHDWLPILQTFPPEKAMKILSELCRLDKTGKQPIISFDSPLEQVVFDNMAKIVEKNREAYLVKCERNKANGARGGKAKKQTLNDGSERLPKKANGSDRLRTVANAYFPHDNDNDNDNDKDNGIDNENEKEKENGTDTDFLYMRKEAPSDIFIPPSVQDVEIYCMNKGYAIDAEGFVDFYASKGWMVGKNQMKDWHAAVRNWARNSRKVSGTQSVMDEMKDW